MPIPVIPDKDSVSSTTNDDSEPNTSFGDDEISNANQFSSNGQSVSISTAGTNDDSERFGDVTSTVSELATTETFFLPEHEDDDDAVAIETNLIEYDPIKEEPEFELDEGEQILFDDILADIEEHCDSSQSAEGEKSNGDLNGESDDKPILLEEDKAKEFPMPMAANLLGLMKREGDPISGSLAFNERVNVYNINVSGI